MMREIAVVAVAALAGSIAAAWPWVREAASAIPDAAAAGNPAWGADARLIIWILSWDVHALLTQPLHFFDANIFHPARAMLTGSELLLGSVPLFAPIYLASGNPVLATNVAALATYPLAGLAMYVLARRLGLAPCAAGVAAVALPLGALRVPGEFHVLQYPNYALVLLLLALVAAGRHPHGARLWWLNGAMLLALLSSFYLAAMATIVVAIELAIVAATMGAIRAVRVGFALVPALVVIVVVALPYFGITRSIGPPAPVDLAMLGDFMRVTQPKILTVAGSMGGMAVPWLALLGLASPLLLRRAPSVRWWRWLAIALVASVLAAGPVVWVGDHLVPLPGALPLLLPVGPLRAALRFFTATRFLVLAQIGMVGMAAEAAALILAAAARFGAGGAVRAGLGMLLLAGAALPSGLHLADTPRTRLPVGAAVPSYYRFLAAQPREPLLEIPAPSVSPASMLVQSDIMYLSTFHWLPLVNGHTGWRPWWFLSIANEAAALPDPDALQAMVDLTGVRWILVRRDRVPAAVAERWASAATAQGLSPVPAGETALLFRVDVPARRGWARALARARRPAGETEAGTPLGLLPTSTTHGELGCPWAPPVTAAGDSITLRLVAHNDGDTDWPAMLPPWTSDDYLVVVGATWSDASGAPYGAPVFLRLPRDVAVRDRITWQASVTAPDREGAFTLELRLRQREGEAFATSAPLRLPMRVGPARAGARS